MTAVEILSMVVRGIATLAHNPALGGGGMKAERISSLLDQFATLVDGGQETWTELKAFGEEIQALVDQNGEPSRGQWEAMAARDAAVRAKLEELRVELSKDPPQDPPQDPPAAKAAATKAKAGKTPS